jgi:hypothetical protein
MGWITVRNCLSLVKDKVIDVVANRYNVCWWGQWWKHWDCQYEIVQGFWSTCSTKGVANPIGIRWVDQKWKGWTLQKLYSCIHSICVRAKAEEEEGSYEDHLCDRTTSEMRVLSSRIQIGWFSTKREYNKHTYEAFKTITSLKITLLHFSLKITRWEAKGASKGRTYLWKCFVGDVAKRQ